MVIFFGFVQHPFIKVNTPQVPQRAFDSLEVVDFFHEGQGLGIVILGHVQPLAAKTDISEVAQDVGLSRLVAGFSHPFQGLEKVGFGFFQIIFFQAGIPEFFELSTFFHRIHDPVNGPDPP